MPAAERRDAEKMERAFLHAWSTRSKYCGGYFFPLVAPWEQILLWSWEGGRTLAKSVTMASMKNPESCPESLVVGARA